MKSSAFLVFYLLYLSCDCRESIHRRRLDFITNSTLRQNKPKWAQTTRTTKEDLTTIPTMAQRLLYPQEIVLTNFSNPGYHKQLSVLTRLGLSDLSVYFGPVTLRHRKKKDSNTMGYLVGSGENITYNNERCLNESWHWYCHFNRRTFSIEHFYQQDKDVRERFKIPDLNVIMPCDPNVTDMCTPNTNPLCLSDGTIMCVAKIHKTQNCSEQVSCVTFPFPCTGYSQHCDQTKMVGIPCFAQAGIPGNINLNAINKINHTIGAEWSVPRGKIASKTNGTKDWSVYCVTAVAKPVFDVEVEGGASLVLLFLSLFTG